MDMDSRTVLIPGAGGAAGIGAMKSLRQGGFDGRIVATDADETAAGLYLADEGHVVPRANEAGFRDAVRDVVARADVDVVLPTTGYDLPHYAALRDELAEDGVTVVVSDPAVVDRCTDKLAFHEALAADHPMPRTATHPDDLDRYPCFVKPVRGKGSRGVARCEDREAALAAMDRDEPMLVQEYLPGEEYTVDVLSDLDGEPILAVPRVRIETKAGISVKGRTVRDPDIEATCLAAAADLGLAGPSCMQLKRDAEGVARFVEVNPRLGGGTIFATLAGVNLPLLTLRLARNENVMSIEHNEVTISRFFDEVLVDDSRLKRNPET
jgi:carbamoyl-phosphate synthase large subunit